jgi:hypothetical protein
MCIATIMDLNRTRMAAANILMLRMTTATLTDILFTT